MKHLVIFMLVCLTTISCRKDDVELTENSSVHSNDQNQPPPYYEYDYNTEFSGEVAYFKGAITDTTFGQSLEGYTLLNCQGFGFQYTIANGLYHLGNAKGELTGYINHSYPELDTVYMKLLDQNKEFVDSLYLLSDTLVYNDTISFDIQF